ncbi:hypothetical protein E4U43_000744 [Claviceps pusilla]|uniref:Panthothenate kinase/uridine kinase-related protein n=1 Tax=Claviceps pusilla TaxID=123648 RepID=A0A9P7SXF5_9HYPO|nr:hypothetical protein E4U43_000744 [Claviceps pusilla]
MDSQVDRLVDKAWAKYTQLRPDQRLLIGIAGIPGSGKTTLSRILTQSLNNRASQDHPHLPPPPPHHHHQTPSASLAPPAIYIPMDGFHLPREALSAMPNPAEAHARRGAPFTFDAPKLLALIRKLRAPVDLSTSSTSSGGGGIILAPSFDHAIKDPKEDDISVLPTHRIVILEGNYLALDKDVWRDGAKLLDELWFVEVDFGVARARLRERHVRAGIVKTVEEGDKRAVENDLVNGEEIVRCRMAVDEVISSREDGRWVHE